MPHTQTHCDAAASPSAQTARAFRDILRSLEDTGNQRQPRRGAKINGGFETGKNTHARKLARKLKKKNQQSIVYGRELVKRFMVYRKSTVHANI
jgi:hypothetical protein